MVKSPGAPCRDGSARFFFSRVRFARRVQSDFPVCEPGKHDDSPLCALSFGRAFSDVKRPATTRTSRTRARTGDGRTTRIRRGRVAIASLGRLEDPEVSRESDTRRRTAPTSERPRNPSFSGCPSLFDVPLAPPRPSRRGRRIRRPERISADGRGGRGRVQAVAGAGSRTPRVGLPVRRGDPVGQPAGSCRSRIKKNLLKSPQNAFFTRSCAHPNPSRVAC